MTEIHKCGEAGLKSGKYEIHMMGYVAQQIADEHKDFVGGDVATLSKHMTKILASYIFVKFSKTRWPVILGITTAFFDFL